MHVPQRETGMTPYEIMLSESQERMLIAVKKGREAEVERIFEKWDLHAAQIGFVTDDGLMRVKDHGTIVAEIPNTALVDEAPVYDRPTSASRLHRRGAAVRRHATAVRRSGAEPDATARVPDDCQQAMGLSAV